MFCKRCALRSVLICFYFLFAGKAMAQPSLPDMAATTSKGQVILSWNCQFNGVKSITVLRSADSNKNFSTIGTVKNIDKGIQLYMDEKPLPGKNYYQLSIQFVSNLKWSSNVCKAYADKNQLDSRPANTPPGAADPKNDKGKLSLKFDDPSAGPPTFIKSNYIFTDPSTGHVRMELPDDVIKRHYSVKFYDMDGNLIFEVPRINASKIIMDKRNFQQKGIYKFILRRDAAELETGYVTIF